VLTDVAGVYENWPHDQERYIAQLSTSELAELMPTLVAGMVPKMRACLQAVLAGVPAASVIDGRVRHALLLEIFTDAVSARWWCADGRLRHHRVAAATAPCPARRQAAVRLGGGADRSLLQRLMNTYGSPQRVLVRGEGATSGTPTARATSTCSVALRSTRSGTRTHSSSRR
jgi:hypothetical protein